MNQSLGRVNLLSFWKSRAWKAVFGSRILKQPKISRDPNKTDLEFNFSDFSTEKKKISPNFFSISFKERKSTDQFLVPAAGFESRDSPVKGHSCNHCVSTTYWLIEPHQLLMALLIPGDSLLLFSLLENIFIKQNFSSRTSAAILQFVFTGGD